MPETFSPTLRVSDPDMYHGTCVPQLPRCLPGSLTGGFLWSRWQEKRSRHSRRMRNSQFHVSGKWTMGCSPVVCLVPVPPTHLISSLAILVLVSVNSYIIIDRQLFISWKMVSWFVAPKILCGRSSPWIVKTTITWWRPDPATRSPIQALCEENPPNSDPTTIMRQIPTMCSCIVEMCIYQTYRSFVCACAIARLIPTAARFIKLILEDWNFIYIISLKSYWVGDHQLLRKWPVARLASNYYHYRHTMTDLRPCCCMCPGTK